MRGEQAIQALGDKLTEVAAWYGMTPRDIGEMMRRDPNAWLDARARLHYVDRFPPPPEADDGTLAGTPTAATPFPADQTFRLHSRPGAKRTICLDFDGHLVTSSAWNSYFGLSAIDALPFDIDGFPSSFGAAELERIQRIWQRIAEDYAPFDVDVSTEEPLSDAITRSGTSDDVFGTRVVMTRDFATNRGNPCGCGGIAYVGVFDEIGDGYKPASAFFDRLGNGHEKHIAEAASHEAGRNPGLSHDGYNNGTTFRSY